MPVPPVVGVLNRFCGQLRTTRQKLERFQKNRELFLLYEATAPQDDGHIVVEPVMLNLLTGLGNDGLNVKGVRVVVHLSALIP